MMIFAIIGASLMFVPGPVKRLGFVPCLQELPKNQGIPWLRAFSFGNHRVPEAPKEPLKGVF